MEEIIGSYRVTRVLGEGGMGRVYLAQHTVIGKLAAIKVLLPQFSTQPDVVNRFLNEARSSSLLKHPGVVDVYDFGVTPSGSVFLVMEYLEGETLAARIKREQRLPAPRIVDIVRQLTNALALAHARGIVHRDLKPENIFLVSDLEARSGERTKILDFGIAKLTESDGSNPLQTRTGTIMGTPVYMSPEQCRGAGLVDYRSDIYSLGCVMFEMAAGQPPFGGGGPGEIIGAHLFSPPPSLQGIVPDDLAELIAHMLAKEPSARVQSMGDVGAALERMGAPDVRKSAPTIVLDAVRPPPAVAEHSQTGPRTTLGGATGEVHAAPAGHERPARGGAGKLVAGACAIVAVGGLFVWHPWSTAAAARSESPGAPAVEAPAAPPAVPAPAPPEVAPPPEKRASVRIVSEPSGAEIYRAADNSRIGTTPWTSEHVASSDQTMYRLHAKGYRDVTIAVKNDQVVEKVVALEKLERPEKKRARAKLPPRSRTAFSTRFTNHPSGAHLTRARRTHATALALGTIGDGAVDGAGAAAGDACLTHVRAAAVVRTARRAVAVGRTHFALRGRRIHTQAGGHEWAAHARRAAGRRREGRRVRAGRGVARLRAALTAPLTR